jgi:simple sugar transport system permease protein
VALAVAAPLLAIVFSLLVTSLVLLTTGAPPLATWQAMIEYAGKPRTEVLILNSATTYYFAAVAVAIGFRMNLFNIGVDGQYRLAAMLSAALGGLVSLPSVLHVALIILTAMLVGALWAGFAGYLKVRRVVSEVISTIMLNFVATGLIAYLLAPGRLAVSTVGSNNLGTKPIPESGQVPGMAVVPGTPLKVYGLIVLAAVVGAVFWFLINRTRFGFDLRATGMNESAAIASGVDVRKMVVASMVLSGAVAGLVGMPQLLGASYTYSLDFPAGLGFTGIAIALLGRNHPVGIAIGALLWGFLDNSAQILNLRDVPVEIVQITQGVIVLSVVVAYELVRRYRVSSVQRDVGRKLAQDAPPDDGPPQASAGAANQGVPA